MKTERPWCLYEVIDQGERFKVKIAASTMRTLNKLGGLERFLLASDNSKLSNEAIKIKNKLSKKLSPNK